MGLYGETSRLQRWLSAVLVFVMVLTASGYGSWAPQAHASTTWTTQTSSVTNDLLGMAYGNGQYVGVGSLGTIIRSSNGTAWTNTSLAGTLNGIYYGGGQWIIVGKTSGTANGLVYTSPDGVSWTLRTTGVTQELFSVTHNGSLYVAVGASGRIITSPDGVAWTARTSNAAVALNSVTYAAGKFVVVGANGTLLTSTDGITWTPQTSGTTSTFYGVSYGNGLYVAVGVGGQIRTSTNGTSWMPQVSPSGTVDLYSVSYGGGKYVAVGDMETIMSSLDGSNWSEERTGAGYFNFVAHGGDKFFAMGYNGLLVTQDAPKNNNAFLSNLTVSQGTLSPGFLPATTSYSVTVPGATSNLSITPTLADMAASVTVNGTAVPNGTPANVPLNVGSNSISVVVTAEDGVTTRTYTVTVTRTGSNDANLSSLTLSQGTLSPAFAAATTSYSANVANGVTSVDVTPTVAESHATVQVNGVATTSGSARNVPLNVGANAITVHVTAEDGTTVKTYTVTVNRAPSNNANLTNLTLSQGTLSPAFAAGTLSYTASVSNAVTSVNVTATTDGTSSLTINGTAATSGNAVNVPLNAGTNNINIVVTAQDGTTVRTYTVAISRGPSSNATLSNLALSQGTLSPAFAAGTLSYTATVANGVTSVNVTPTLGDSNATLTVNGTATTNNTPFNVPLNVGTNTLNVGVTAQDGTTVQTYTVTVTRLQSSNNDLSSMTLSQGTLSPSFAAGTTSYTASVANGVTSLLITPAVADGTATLAVNGTASPSGTAVNVPLTVGPNPIAVRVTAQDGAVKTYTVTVTRAASSNADLNSLALSQGTLSPVFAAGTLSYTASVANGVTSVDVTASLADSTATFTVNGAATASGTPVNVPLTVGNNTINVAVLAQDGTTSKTYTVVINRAPSDNAYLNGLTLSQGTLSPAFAAGTFSYSASVANAVTSVNVTPTVADSTAVVRVNGTIIASGSPHNVPLTVGSNTINVDVHAQDGTTVQVYTITVTRAASSNANLSALALSQGTLSPAFATGTLTYTASVANGVTSVNVTPTAADSTATLTVNGTTTPSGSAVNVPLTVGANTVSIVATAQDGVSTQTYTVTITRAPSTNADLSGLTLTQGTLSPAFASGTLTYTASVGNAVTSVDVTATAADGTATLAVNGTTVASGSAVTRPLAVGPNTVTVTVTAQDGTTTRTYTITIDRAPSTNADLNGLALSQGTLTPAFAANTLTYTADVANAITSLTVTPQLADSTASLTVNGTATPNGTAVNVPLNVGSNTITVVVTAQDGTTVQTYTITVTRALSSNANLSNLTLSAGTLAPAFAPGTLTYTASVNHAVTSLDLTPVVANSAASLVVNGTVATSGNAVTIPLTVGQNTIDVVVTAQDGVSTQTYTLTVTRHLPNNADLSALVLSQGTLTPAFAAGTTSYTAAVANTVTSLDVTPTLADPLATLRVNGTLATDGAAVTIPLHVGANAITVTVGAQDGTTQRTYTITVTRAGVDTPPPPPPPVPVENIRGVIEVVDAAGQPLHEKLTHRIGANLKLLGHLYTNDGSRLLQPNVQVGADGNFKLDPLVPGTYQLVLTVLAPDGTKLAGRLATLSLNDKGLAVAKAEQLNPFGTAIDAMTDKPISGVQVSLYWADTPLNRSQGRTPGTLVTLPELGQMKPGQNRNVQVTAAEGQFGWMLPIDSDVYLLAEKKGYDSYDSRQDPNTGILRVRQTAIQVSVKLQAQVVEELLYLPYITGYPDNTFRPNQSLTRAELAVILLRVLPQQAAPDIQFTDVPASSWAAKAISDVNHRGLMIGYPDGSFHPDQPLTRAEMAVVLNKLQQLAATTKDAPFRDLIGHWAQDAILRAFHAGLISGYPDGTFRPNQGITRAETVVLLNKFLGLQPLNANDPQKWSDVTPDYWAYDRIMEASVAHHLLKYANGEQVWKR